MRVSVTTGLRLRGVPGPHIKSNSDEKQPISGPLLGLGQSHEQNRREQYGPLEIWELKATEGGLVYS